MLQHPLPPTPRPPPPSQTPPPANSPNATHIANNKYRLRTTSSKIYRFTLYITKTRLFKYIENFTIKNLKFSDKNADIYHISAQNIDCWYSLEPPLRGGSNEYPQSKILSRNTRNNATPVNPSFAI